MKRILSLLTLEFFLICSLGSDPALLRPSTFAKATVDRSGFVGQALQNPFPSRLGQTLLRPRSGISTSQEIERALDGGKGKDLLSGRAHVSVVMHLQSGGMELIINHMNQKERYFISNIVVLIIPENAPTEMSSPTVFKAVDEAKTGTVWQPVEEEVFVEFLEELADFLYGFQATDPVLPAQFQMYFFMKELDVTYDADGITVAFGGKTNFFDRKTGEVRDARGGLVDPEDERQESTPLLAILPQFFNPKAREETLSRLNTVEGNYRAFLMNPSDTSEQSSADGGKKMPRAARRKTDEEAKVDYLYIQFDALHSELDTLATLFELKKGDLSGEAYNNFRLYLSRLLERLQTLAQEFPESLPADADVETLQKINKELERGIRILHEKIVKAYEARDDVLLTTLNAEITPKLWLRAAVEAKLAYHFFVYKKNPSAALALLIGARNRMSDLQTEYYWRRVRPYIDRGVTTKMVRDFFGFPVEVVYLGNYDIRIAPDETVILYRRVWKKRLVPGEGGKMVSVLVAEPTPFKFQDMPTALRSEVHSIVSQEKAYGGILHAQSNLQHIIFRTEQERKKHGPMPRKELETALDITHRWVRLGKASDLRRRALPDFDAAKTYLEEEQYEEAVASLKRAKAELGKVLPRLDGTREGTRKRTLVWLNEWRNYTENRERLLAGLREAVPFLDARNPLQAINHLLRLRGAVFPKGKPRLETLANVYDRFEPTLKILRNAAGLQGQKEQTAKIKQAIASLSESARKNLGFMLADLGAKEEDTTARDGAERQKSARDGGRQASESDKRKRRIKDLAIKVVKGHVEPDRDLLSKMARVTRYVVNRHVSRQGESGRVSVQDLQEFRKVIEPLVGQTIAMLLPEYQLTESDLDEIYFMFLSLIVPNLLDEKSYSLALQIVVSGVLTQQQMQRLALLAPPFHVIDTPAGATKHEVMTLVDDTKTAEAVLLLQDAITRIGKSLSLGEQKETQIYVSVIAEDQMRNHFNEDLSARDGGDRAVSVSRHTRAQFRNAYYRLKRRLGRAPDSFELAEVLGFSQKQALRRSAQENFKLTPAQTSGLTRYAQGKSEEPPPDQPVKLRVRERPQGNSLVVSLGEVDVEGLPESLGRPNANALVHFERKSPVKRDLVASFWPASADRQTEPPHASRVLTINNGKIEVVKTADHNRLHHLRQLRQKGIVYQRLPKYVRENTPGQVLAKLALFEEAALPVQWSWFMYSPQRIEELIAAEQEARRKKEEADAEFLRRLEPFQPIPDFVRNRIGTPQEILARIALFENHGIPFSPLYWERATDSQKQKVLETIPYLQFLHFILRLYGFEDPLLRKILIERYPAPLLGGGARSRLIRLRRPLMPHLGKEISIMRPALERFTQIFEKPHYAREDLLRDWLDMRVDSSKPNPILRRQTLRLITLYDAYLQNGNATRALTRLEELKKEVRNRKLRIDVNNFIALLEEIQAGKYPSVKRTDVRYEGAAARKERKKRRDFSYRKPAPEWPRLFEEKEIPTWEAWVQDQFRIRKDLAGAKLLELERSDLEGLTRYLRAVEKGTLIPYTDLLKTGSLSLIRSPELLKRALGLLSQRGFVLSYVNGGVRVLGAPFVATEVVLPVARDGAEQTVPQRVARDGGRQDSGDGARQSQIEALALEIANKRVAPYEEFLFPMVKITRYVVNRQKKRELVAAQDLKEFEKVMDPLVGEMIKTLLAKYELTESDLDEIYVALLSLFIPELLAQRNYALALQIADSGLLTPQQMQKLALLESPDLLDKPPDGLQHQVIAQVDDKETARALVFVEEIIPPLSPKERHDVREYVFNIAADRIRNFFGEKLTASDGGRKSLARDGADRQLRPLLQEIRPAEVLLYSP